MIKAECFKSQPKKRAFLMKDPCGMKLKIKEPIDGKWIKNNQSMVTRVLKIS